MNARKVLTLPDGT